METVIALFFVSFGLISLFRPIVLLYLLVTLPVLSSIPTITAEEGQFKVTHLGSVNIFTSDILIALIPIILVITIITKVRNEERPLKYIFDSPISTIVLLMFLWEVFIGILSYQKGLGLQNVIRKLSTNIIMFVVFIIPLLDMHINKEKFFKFTIFLALLLSGFAITKYFVFNQIEYTSSGTVRTLLGNDVVILLFPICYILFHSNLWKRNMAVSMITIIVLFLGIHLAGHRSGYIAFVFVIACHYFINVKEKARFLWVPSFGVFILGSVLLIPSMINIGPERGLIQDMIVRFQDTFDPKNKTTQERLDLWKYSEVVMAERPIIGYGRLPAYSFEFEENSGAQAAGIEGIDEIKGYTHNFIVDKFLHQGLLGVGVLFCFIFITLKQGFEFRKINPGYADFLIVYILSFFIFSLFNTPFTSFSSVFLYAAVGFLNLEILNAKSMRRSGYR